jgi:hypothetical protein
VFLGSAVSAQVINGCVKAKNGALRIVADPADCTPRETPISWNQVGPQGEPGLDGEPGPQGPPGPVLHVFDGLGNDLGLYAGYAGFPPHNSVAVHLDSGIIIRIGFRDGRHEPNTDFNAFFRETATEGGCQGQAFEATHPRFLARHVFQPGAELFISRFEPARVELFQSVLSGGCSDIPPLSILAIPADPITEAELGITFPVPLPIYVGSVPGSEP